jgi:hypothetical protein
MTRREKGEPGVPALERGGVCGECSAGEAERAVPEGTTDIPAAAGDLGRERSWRCRFE